MKLSAERLETIRHCYAGEGCEGCPSYQEISGAPKDCPIECQAYETAVNSLLSHIAAQDEEIEQIKYTEEMNGEIIEGLKAEVERLRAVHEAELGVCEQHCEVVKRLREQLRLTHIDWANSEAEIERLRAFLESGQLIQFEGLPHRAILADDVEAALGGEA